MPQLAQQIKERLIKTYSIVTYPKALPNYDSAKAIYMQNCTQCHGDSGKGDGPGQRVDEPKSSGASQFYRCGIHGRTLALQSLQHHHFRHR